jgi:hypothetical protein
MGMDVYGIAPTDDAGEYFRNNVWWWHPLWDYCLNLHGDICDKVERGHENSGDGLDASDAEALSQRLLDDIKNGVTAEYERSYREHIASLPSHECKWCNGTGIRSDEIGVQVGMPTRQLDEDLSVVLGRTHGWCNACSGEGKIMAWEANYQFAVSNVEEFANFLLECGGFQIY